MGRSSKAAPFSIDEEENDAVAACVVEECVDPPGILVDSMLAG